MQNGPPLSKVDHTSCCVISKLFTQKSPINYKEPSKNVGNLLVTTGDSRTGFFCSDFGPLKAVTTTMVRAIAFLVIYAQPSHEELGTQTKILGSLDPGGGFIFIL